MTDEISQEIKLASTLGATQNDLPEWLLSDRVGDEKKFTDYMIEASTREYLRSDKNIAGKYTTDPRFRAETDATIKQLVVSRTKTIRDKAERAFIYQVYEAHQTGWFRNLPAGFDTIYDLLTNIVEGSAEGTSEAYNVGFLATTVVPILEKAGVPAEKVWGIPFLPRKAAEIVPAMRALLSCPVCGEKKINGSQCANGHDIELADQKLETAVGLVMMVGDETKSITDIKAKVAEIKGVETNAPRQIEYGEVYLFPSEEWLLIRAPSATHSKAVQIALKNIVKQWNVTDLIILAKDLSVRVSGVDLLKPAEEIASDDYVDLVF